MKDSERKKLPGSEQSITRLVFIASQPRAGSTLLQTMLEGHPRIMAPGETWLMLPLIHSLIGSGRTVEAPYDAVSADEAIHLFAQEHLPQGIATIQDAIGLAATRIYDSARKHAGADVLVDKTPRYYWIVEELLNWIPECRVIILVRNPLAVMSSIVTTWSRRLSRYRADLLEAPPRLANAMGCGDPRVLHVCYEELARDPETTLETIQRFIGIDVVENLSHYGVAKKRAYGDPTGIFDDTAANQKSIEKWLSLAGTSAANWRLLNDYRLLLGSDLLKRLGYDSDELGELLQGVRPLGTRMAPSLEAQLGYGSAEPMKSIVSIQRLCADAVTRMGRAA